MKRNVQTNILMLFYSIFFTSLISFGQSKDTSNLNQYEVWRQRINIGISAGYPTIPFINLGFKFYDKIYIDIFIEPGETKKYSTYFDFGYQKNNIFNKNFLGQVGFSLIQAANKNETKKHTIPGISFKLVKPISKRFGLFVCSHLGYPDDRINYEKLVNINIGIDMYFRQVPFVFY